MSTPKNMMYELSLSTNKASPPKRPLACAFEGESRFHYTFAFKEAQGSASQGAFMFGGVPMGWSTLDSRGQSDTRAKLWQFTTVILTTTNYFFFLYYNIYNLQMRKILFVYKKNGLTKQTNSS